MKKNFIYLLLFFSLIAQAQVTPSYPTIKLTKTVEGVKQDSLLVLGTDKIVKHIPSSKITSILEYTTASALPITGVPGKIYVTKDNGKIYRWNGTYYTELAITDISGKVDKIVGKGLSTEDYTTPEKTKLAELFNYDPTTINNAIALKVDKVTGKSLLSDTEITRLTTLSNYTHPTNHPPSIITQDASNRFVTDVEKTAWNAKQGALGFTPENVSNKQNSLAVDGTNTKYPTVTAVNTGLDLKANDSDVVHKSGNETITGVKSFQGYVPEIKLVETTNNNSVSLRSNSLGSPSFGFYGKTGKKLFSFVPGISGEAKMVIGDVDFPNDSQLLVYGGGGGANIDARGSNSADESNLDLENSDWLTNPKSIGLTTFGDNFNLGGDILGYERKKSSVLRFSNDKSFITSLAPIRLGINNLEIGNVNSTGIEAISFKKSSVPSSNILLAGGGDISQAGLPISTATQTALDLKANLASPALTGTPTAPTATAGTNTTQIATTAFVLANAKSIPQLESNDTDKTVWNNGKGNIDGNTSFGDEALKSNTTGNYNTAFGVSALFNNTNNGNTAIGHGALANNVSGTTNVAIGFNAGSLSGGSNIVTSVFIGASALPLANSDANEIVIGYNAKGAGSNTATLGNTSITSTVLRGAVSGGSFIKSSAPTTNILLAGGGDIAQNTAFNKNFGTTAGTVVEGGTLGSNAYTSTAYLPLSGGALTGALNGTSGNFSSSVTATSFISGRYNYDMNGITIRNSANNAGLWSINKGAGDGSENWNFYNFERNLIDFSLKNDTGVATFSSTVTAASYTATSLPVFENNAAASSLAVGQFYRTSIGVLMVKF